MEETGEIQENGEKSNEQVASNECNKEIELLELPNEILQRIFINLDDKDMLIVSDVCKSFAANTEIAFAQKYSGRRFSINSNHGSIEIERLILSKYGEKILQLSVIKVKDSDK